MTQHVGLIGYPLDHTVSPAFQQAAFDHYSLPVRYHAWPTPPEALGDRVRRLQNEEYMGANVTVPHKERVQEFLDGVDPWAERIGAVNTIVREDDRLVGYNTDAYGFIRGLTRDGGFDPRNKRVLLLGAGGGARAAAFGLAREHIASLTIANRTAERARLLADDLRGSLDEVTAIPMAGPPLDEAVRGVDLIVNSTSVGMRHGGGEGRSPLPTRPIPSGVLVYDVVYNPPDTPLLLEARKAGARALGGLPMLVHQGAAAFEHWTGRDAPVEVMFRAAEQALAALSATG